MQKTCYQGQFIKVTEEEIDNAVWERVFLRNGVVVFPVTHEGNIVMIREKRPHEEAGERVKFVAGHIDEDEHDPLETANRELQEEVGLKASKLELIFEHHNSGTINNSVYFVKATDLTQSKIPNPDGEDTILEVFEMTPLQIKKGILDRTIPTGISGLGFFKLLETL